MKMLSPKQVADAWNSVTDRWFVRRDKMHDDGRQYEVVHDWGGELVSDDTMRVKRRFASHEAAEAKAKELEDQARAEAVLRAFQ